jgi:hypothetical protein
VRWAAACKSLCFDGLSAGTFAGIVGLGVVAPLVVVGEAVKACPVRIPIAFKL